MEKKIGSRGQPVPERVRLENRYKNARSNLLLVTIFTVVNIVLLLAKSNLFFLFSAYIPYVIVVFGMLLCGRLPEGDFQMADSLGTLTLVGFVAIAMILTALYLVGWILSGKGRAGWLTFGLVAFAIDTVLLFLLQGIQLDSLVDYAYHIWAIVSFSMGISAGLKLKKLPPEEEDGPEYPEIAREIPED